MNKTDKIRAIQKILALKVAFEDVGIPVELDSNAIWFGPDCKTHYGIELSVYIPSYGDHLSFLFKPDGTSIHNCLEAPTKLD